jgi:hypothetical protein
VSVDYRLLHHFRVSQRREMASRGELPTRLLDHPVAGDPAERRGAAAEAPRIQVLTRLLNEDR